MPDRQNDFSQGSIPRSIMSLALPMTAAQPVGGLAHVLYPVPPSGAAGERGPGGMKNGPAAWRGGAGMERFSFSPQTPPRRTGSGR